MASLKELLEQGETLEVQGKYEDAHQCLTDAIEQARPTNDNILAELLNHRGIVKRMLEDYDGAFIDYQTVFDASPSDEQRALAHINIADIQRVAKSDFDAAHVSLDEALTYVENSSIIHAKAVDQRGLVFVGQKDYTSAIACYRRAKEICEILIEKIPDDKELLNRFGQVVHHLGAAYVFLNDPEKINDAYESQITALDIFSKLGDQQGIVNCVTTIGRIVMIKEDYEGAIEPYDKAMKILEKTGYQRAITCLNLHLAEAHLAKGNSGDGKRILEEFRSGVLQGNLTEHDLGLIKDRFVHVKSLCKCAEINLDFDTLNAYF